VSAARARRHHSSPRERATVARRVRELREARGLTQAALAGQEFTKGFISQLETGRVGLSLRAANTFAQRLGVSVGDLMRVPDEAERLAELTLIEAERELAQGSPERALSLSRRIRASAGFRGRSLRLQGRALLHLDKAGEALPVLERALDSFRASQDREGAVRTLHDLAYGQARLDRPELVLALLLQCEQALRSGEMVDRTFELEVESFLASTYARIGNFAEAEARVKRAQEMAEDVVNHDALAALYGQLAGTEQQGGNFEKALELWRKCLRELDLAGRERQVADTWHNIAVTYLRLGAHDKARASLARAEEMQQETGHARLGAWIKVTRAKIAMEERRLGEAEKLLREAAGDQSATSLARGEALLALAQIQSRRRVPLGKIREAFNAVLKEIAAEPIGTRVRALKLYSDALKAAGDVEAAFEKSREALELLRPGN
jgi:tetratricopeptide (TPR) repeat protein